ncbi:MAG: MBL fold metallo-hydrolase [Anaerolineales bacterium]
MEITWYGHSCFRLTERNYATVVTDPFDNKSIGYSALKLKSDIVTVSHDAPGHNNVDAVKGASHVIDGAGEFEIGGVFVTGVSTDGGGSGKKKGKDGSARNTIYVFDYDGITVAHLGDLKQTPTQSEIESLGTINVALVPVGGGGGQRGESGGGHQPHRAEHRRADALLHARGQTLARRAQQIRQRDGAVEARDSAVPESDALRSPR